MRTIGDSRWSPSSQADAGAERLHVEDILQRLESVSTSITAWRYKGALLLDLLRVLDKLEAYKQE